MGIRMFGIPRVVGSSVLADCSHETGQQGRFQLDCLVVNHNDITAVVSPVIKNVNNICVQAST